MIAILEPELSGKLSLAERWLAATDPVFLPILNGERKSQSEAVRFCGRCLWRRPWPVVGGNSFFQAMARVLVRRQPSRPSL